MEKNSRFKILEGQLAPTIRLALPVVIAQLSQMLMGLVDTYMVGKLGPQFIGGVAVGNAFHVTLSIFGIGLLLGLDYLISFAYGQKNLAICHYWLIQGIYFVLLMAVPLTLASYFLSFHLDKFGINPEIAVQAGLFLRTFCFSLTPFLLFAVFRQYLQAMNCVKIITFISIAANFLNAGFNWLFIYGRWGISPMGVAGSGIATTLTRSLMVAAIGIFIIWRDQKFKLGLIQAPFRIDLPGIARMTKLGLPAAFQLTFEIAVFSLATAFAGTLGVIPLASHTIVLNIASLTFMVPLGISAAAAVRVGQFLGERKPDKAQGAGWIAILLATGFMATSGFFLFFAGRPIAGLFTQNLNVISLCINLLVYAALFQIADGIQVVGTGALRGYSDTRSPMFANFVGHWLIGLPLGYYLCFHRGASVSGLWSGLTLGLGIVATLVLYNWHRRSSQATTSLLEPVPLLQT